MRAWHFVGEKLRDGREIPPDGEWLTHEGEIIMCEQGLHASKHLTDALKYAPGNTVCRVELRNFISDTDKLVGGKRKILWRLDAAIVLKKFSRMCALDVIHLWSPPEVVKQFLKTGEESIMAAAWAAAWADYAYAARDAAAAWAAAEAAARDAADAAAWAAAWAAVWAADGDASAADAAAEAAAWAAAGNAQERRLVRMIHQAHRDA